MITQVRCDKMVVISDLHLGNPLSRYQDRIFQFSIWAAEQGYDLCINGDGIDFAQLSERQLNREVPELLRVLRLVGQRGRRVFYIVGNHDALLENFVLDSPTLTVVPYLNLQIGGKRIHIEHGHVYDPLFLWNPVLYERLTRLGGTLLKFSPAAYRLGIKLEQRLLKAKSMGAGIPGEATSFRAMAEEVCERGYDVVVFGHTHRPGEVDLGGGKRYLNCGSWLLPDAHYVAIEPQGVELRKWQAGGIEA